MASPPTHHIKERGEEGGLDFTFSRSAATNNNKGTINSNNGVFATAAGGQMGNREMSVSARPSVLRP